MAGINFWLWQVPGLAVAGTRFGRGRYQVWPWQVSTFGCGRYQVWPWQVPGFLVACAKYVPPGVKTLFPQKRSVYHDRETPQNYIPPAPQHAASTSIRESSLKNCIQGARTSGGKVSRLVPPAVPPRCDVDPHCHTYGMLIGVRQPALRT